MVLGLIFAVVLAKGSVLKAIAMVLMGLLLSMVGSDLETGAGRMTFDIPELADGIGAVAFPITLFVDSDGMIVDQTGPLDEGELRSNVADLEAHEAST